MRKKKVFLYNADHKEAFNVVITGIKYDLKALQVEKDRLQGLWLESQKELVDFKDKCKAMKKENEVLAVIMIL